MNIATFVAFEGGEGTGKSTQAARLATRIGALLTREPGGTPLGERVRALVLDPGLPVVPRAEALLMAAARAQHVDLLIRPALERGEHVVTDRFTGSSLAYQGIARDLGVDAIAALSAFATGALLPDVTVLLDLPLAVATARLTGDRDRMEQEGAGFHAAVVAGFRTLAAVDPTWVVVDAGGTPDEVEAAVWAAVEPVVTPDRGRKGGVAVAALFSDIPGQERAVAQLVAAATRPSHAYLLVGPPGVGKRQAAGALAAAILGGADDPDTARRAKAFAHPDVRLYDRAGAYLSVEDAREITKIAYRGAIEASTQVIVVPDLHLVREAGPALLKTIEEPPPGVAFILLADLLVPELVTIKSRCCTIELQALSPDVLVDVLVAEGHDHDVAVQAAGASGGRLDRARLLVGDPGFASRQAAWRAVPSRLDGSGHVVAGLVDELLGQVESILDPVKRRQAEELAELAALDKISGRASGKTEVNERHKRELRRVRVDELQAGLATLAGAYRDRLVAGRADPSAFAAIRDATAELVRNPNEPLLLSALFLRLGG